MTIEIKHKGQVIARFGADHQSRPAPEVVPPRWNEDAYQDRRARTGRVGK